MLKGLVAWWGKNPVAGNLLMVACAIAGFLSFVKMEKEFFPQPEWLLDAYRHGIFPWYSRERRW